MRLYYKTPRYKNSNFMAHLVEHLLLHPVDVSDIDKYTLLSNIDGYTASDYIYFVYDEFCVNRDFINDIIRRPIDQDVINYEYVIFEEEFWERWYVKRLIDKIYQMIYWPDRSSKPIKYTVDEIKNYINNNVINSKYIYYDNHNYKIIDTNIKYSNQKLPKTYGDALYKMMLLEWSKNHIFYKKVETVYDLVLFDFLNDLISSYDLYQKRYIMWSYYHSPTTFLINNDYVWVRAWVNAICDISEIYFDSYKKYAINGANNGTYEINNVYSILNLWQYAPREEITKYISKLPYSYIKNLVKMIEK